MVAQFTRLLGQQAGEMYSSTGDLEWTLEMDQEPTLGQKRMIHG